MNVSMSTHLLHLAHIWYYLRVFLKLLVLLPTAEEVASRYLSNMHTQLARLCKEQDEKALKSTGIIASHSIFRITLHLTLLRIPCCLLKNNAITHTHLFNSGFRKHKKIPFGLKQGSMLPNEAGAHTDPEPLCCRGAVMITLMINLTTAMWMTFCCQTDKWSNWRQQCSF